MNPKHTTLRILRQLRDQAIRSAEGLPVMLAAPFDQRAMHWDRLIAELEAAP